MSILRQITDSGVSFATTKAERRNIILTNHISLVAAFATLLLLIARTLFAYANLSIVTTLLGGSFLFLLPIALNRLGYFNIARLTLCWIPAFYQLYASIRAIDDAVAYESSTFVGLRFFILAFSCFPFLVFDIKKKNHLFFLGLLGPVLGLFMFDPVLTYFGVGYREVGLNDSSYEFNNVRVAVSIMIIGASSYFLKKLVEESEILNEKLIDELEEKNYLIQRQASEELRKLNIKLLEKVKQLNERQFVLEQSQKIANVGSWEYNHKDGFLFWSDEMFNIFGLDKSLGIQVKSLSQILNSDRKELLDSATKELLNHGTPFDLTLNAQTPLGYKKWFRICGFPVFNDEKITGASGICHDVTYFKESEEKLKASEAKFQKAFEGNPALIMLVRESDKTIVDVNKRAKEIIGYEKEDLVGAQVDKLDLFVNAEQRILFEKSFILNRYTEINCDWKRKDGRIIQTKITATTLVIGDSNYQLAVIEDISIQKAAEEKFLKAFDLSPDLMLIFRERDLVLVDANRKIFEVSGFRREEIVGRSTMDKKFIIWYEPEKRSQFFDQYQKEGQVFMEATLNRKDGNNFFATISAQRIQLEREDHMIVVVRDISWRKEIEMQRELALTELNERVKELTTLYRASQLLHDEKQPLADTMQQLVAILPQGWQYSDIACALIRIGETEFRSENFQTGLHSQSADFSTSYGTFGSVQVHYPESVDALSRPPFLDEERDLIDLIAELTKQYLNRLHEKEELNKAEANLTATINNTEILIWSVDRDFKLISFNKPFQQFIKSLFGVEIKSGGRILDSGSGSAMDDIRKRWSENYLRSLAGEVVQIESSMANMDFQFSLSPIIEDGKVIGVSIFGENITERKARERELSIATTKIAELRLQALRSVMNPHFIFNALNSIQYFITKNDRLNAINYLSMFSKLIRSILTHSVENTIRLTDELELLQNYVKLEMMRFEEKFSFDIVIDNNIDVQSIEIPSLLIQPYVENAILHGLYNKPGRGRLSIAFTEIDDYLIVNVEDNGIGRAAAAELKKNAFNTHKSLGITLTEERLKLLNQQSDASILVEDLFSGDAPAGTRVQIQIRLH